MSNYFDVSDLSCNHIFRKFGCGSGVRVLLCRSVLLGFWSRIVALSLGQLCSRQSATVWLWGPSGAFLCSNTYTQWC